MNLAFDFLKLVGVVGTGSEILTRHHLSLVSTRDRLVPIITILYLHLHCNSDGMWVLLFLSLCIIILVECLFWTFIFWVELVYTLCFVP